MINEGMSATLNPILFWLSLVPAVVLAGYMVWRYVAALQGKPTFAKADVVFQEWFASGCSQKNFITRIGGGRNCLRLVVTKDFLWVTTWFPFSLFAPLYDLEHVIPLHAIKSVTPDKFFGVQTLLLTFMTGTGQPRTLRLRPKQSDAFVTSLGPVIANA